MRAAFYKQQGPARELLKLGDLPEQPPADGEVAVRVRVSGVNPGDMLKRQGSPGSPMVFPRIIPHSDGAGTIEAVGPGVDSSRLGKRVWVWGAQSYRPFGTAAEVVTVPSALAVDLPDAVDDLIGACLGIPGLTAHRAVFADGPVAGKTILVQGVRGAVGSMAAQFARWAGATVIGTVTKKADESEVLTGTADHILALEDGDATEQIRAISANGVDRIVEGAFSDHVDLNAAVAAQACVIATYASSDVRPSMPFWPMIYKNVVIRLLGSDDFPMEARLAGTRDLTAAAAANALHITTAAPFPLADIAAAHEAVEGHKVSGRVLVLI